MQDLMMASICCDLGRKTARPNISAVNLSVWYNQSNMGNKTEKVEGEVGNDRIEWDHSMMKNLSLKQRKEQEILQAIFSMNNKSDYDDWVKMQKKNPSHHLKVGFNPIYFEYQQKGVCGSGGFAKVSVMVTQIQYESFPFMLLGEIVNRRQQSFQQFSETELWYLLYCICKLGKAFHDKSIKVGDIAPKNIFMNSEGNVTIAHQYSWPGEKTNYLNSLHNKEVTYIAPEEISELHIGREEPVTDFKKGESFSVGLTMLDAALLENHTRIYDKHLDINFDQLNQSKQSLKNMKNYGETLKQVILNLLEAEPQNRIKVSRLSEWMEPYAEQIEELVEFEFTEEYPQQIKKTAADNEMPIEKTMVKGPNTGFTPHDYSFKQETKKVFNSPNSIINKMFTNEPSVIERKDSNRETEKRKGEEIIFEKGMRNDTPQFKLDSRKTVVNQHPPPQYQEMQRFHSPEFRPISMLRSDVPVQHQKRQFVRPPTFQPDAMRYVPPSRVSYNSPPPRIVNQVPPGFALPQNAKPAFRVISRSGENGPEQTYQAFNNNLPPPPIISQPELSPRNMTPASVRSSQLPSNQQSSYQPSISGSYDQNNNFMRAATNIPKKTEIRSDEDFEDLPRRKFREDDDFNTNPSITSEEKKQSEELIKAIQHRIRSSREHFPSTLA